MTRAPAILAVLAIACEPAIPGGRSGLRITVRGADGEVDPGVVFVRFEPRDPGSRAWAIDTSGGLPAVRTIWPAVEGEVVVVAGGFACPDGCGRVDPWLDAPTSTGRSAAALRRARTTSVTIVLSASACGNGILEPGESCDGGPACDRCGMDVVTAGEVEGRPGDGIVALAGDSGFVVAWIDGSCGGMPASCLSWIRGGAGPDPSVVESRSLDLGDTTGQIAGDHRSRLAWLTRGGTPTLRALDPWSGGPAIDLGPADSEALPRPAVSGPAAGSPMFAMAVDPETEDLEIRWIGGTGTALSTGASAVPAGTVLSSPAVEVGGPGPIVVAAWAALGEGAGTPSWFVRRWSCSAHPSGCAPVPLEMDAMPLGFDHEPAAGMALVASGLEKPFALVSVLRDDLEVRFLGDGDLPGELADLSAGGVAAAGAVIADAEYGEDGIVALLAAPVAGTAACETRIVSFDPSGSFPPSTIASRGEDGELGCVASIALMPVHRYVAAWRTPGSAAGTVVVKWVVGTLERPF